MSGYGEHGSRPSWMDSFRDSIRNVSHSLAIPTEPGDRRKYRGERKPILLTNKKTRKTTNSYKIFGRRFCKEVAIWYNPNLVTKIWESGR